MKKPIPAPSDAELAILRALWDNSPATAKAIHDVTNAGRKPPRVVTTTAKLLQIMMGKGLVTRDESTWPHTYVPAVSRAAIQRNVVARTVTELFDKSAGQFILAALESGAPSQTEIDEIKAMIAEYEKRGQQHE